MWAIAGRYSAIGIEMALSIVIGFYGGGWLDERYGTKPWLSYAGLGFGIIAAFLALYRIGRRALREERSDSSQGNSGDK